MQQDIYHLFFNELYFGYFQTSKITKSVKSINLKTN